jgi:hypothetical protein
MHKRKIYEQTSQKSEAPKGLMKEREDQNSQAKIDPGRPVNKNTYISLK